ncbi:MAG: hypothetical protein JSU61_07075 [Fidelibacterota bacterium]|nr:MAG: hypothetical protein JSU61_07075 [Candidatus Neomarinimicrobiota bacterium]
MGDITETKIIPGDPFHRLEVLLNSFHLVAVQMKDRRKDGKIPRETLTIGDEYDVQDLLHSLLKIDFNDIRDEEWTPSYAGSAARIDFLLKEEEYAIEVKMASDTLRDKVIGKQLIEDIAHYAPHPDCSHLICFVYDPEYKIKNPQGLVTDLSKMSTDELTVSVFIRPR